MTDQPDSGVRPAQPDVRHGRDAETLRAASGEVTRQFDDGASRYDLLVGLNPGYHAHLDRAANALAQDHPDSRALIDLGCGSGASTRALLRAFGPGIRVVGVDASGGMLARARAKTWPAGVRFLQGRAGELHSLLDAPADGMLAAYLFRNVPAEQRDDALADALAALRPGGTLVVLEYSVAGSARARMVWRTVCRAVIRPLATVLDGNPELYGYLQASVEQFDTIPDFAARMHRAGFERVASRTVPGWQNAILHLVIGRKPR